MNTTAPLSTPPQADPVPSGTSPFPGLSVEPSASPTPSRPRPLWDIPFPRSECGTVSQDPRPIREGLG